MPHNAAPPASPKQLVTAEQREAGPVPETLLTEPMPRTLQHLNASKKLATASHLYWSARQLKSSVLRRLHPDWDDLRIEREVRRIFLLSPGLNR